MTTRPRSRHTFVVMGATGDVVGRYFLPAVAELHAGGALDDGFSVIGLSRADWDTARWRERASAWLAERAAHVPKASRDQVVRRLEFRRCDVTAAQEVRAALQDVEGEPIVYLGLPPAVFDAALRALAATPNTRRARTLIEKPFGEDLESARRLNRLLREQFTEGQVFRVDHFLAEPAVRNILGLRMANPAVEGAWDRRGVERVEVTWNETLTIEGRDQYDRLGALKDVLQNHLLEVLSIVAMDLPTTLDEPAVRDERAAVLESVRPMTAEEVRRHTVRARYTAGSIGKRRVPDYTAEPGVDPQRGTETYASVTLFIDSPRWRDVPFTLTTGKALGQGCYEVVLYLRRSPHSASSRLRIDLTENTLELALTAFVPGDGHPTEPLRLSAPMGDTRWSAYARLLREALDGDQTFFVRADEAEACWRIVTPIIAGWERGTVPLLEYPAGSAGPTAASPTASAA